MGNRSGNRVLSAGGRNDRDRERFSVFGIAKFVDPRHIRPFNTSPPPPPPSPPRRSQAVDERPSSQASSRPAPSKAMSTRIRGEHNTDWGPWRPRASHGGATATAGSLASLNQPTRLAVAGRLGRRSGEASAGYRRRGNTPLWRSSPCLLRRAACFPQRRRRTRCRRRRGRGWTRMRRRRSTTPRGCARRLFAPQLAVAYGTAVHGSCTAYFRRITSFSLVVRRVLEDGGTAVLELRQTVRPQAWAVVLSHRPAGWQAVDLLPGDLVRWIVSSGYFPI